MRITHALIVTMTIAIAGCSAFGVPASSDPNTKLAQARELERQGRFVPARNLLQEALEIFQNRSDQSGVAEAYRQWGLFYQSPMPSGRVSLVPDDFEETKDGRYLKAIEYFEKSLALLKSLNKPDAASNVYFLIARTYHLYLKNDPAACAALEDSRTAHNEAIAMDPIQKFDLPNGYTFDQIIDGAKRESACT